MNIRKVIRILFTFIGILTLYFALLSIPVQINFSKYYQNRYHPEVFSYIDLNGNGIHDAEEPPLPGVCLNRRYNLSTASEYIESFDCDDNWHIKTDISGLWISDHPESNISCKDTYIVAIPPDGYRSTNTPIDNFCDPEFGFVEDENLKVKNFISVDQYAQIQHLKGIGLAIVVIGFALLISIGGTWWLNKE